MLKNLKKHEVKDNLGVTARCAAAGRTRGQVARLARDGELASPLQKGAVFCPYFSNYHLTEIKNFSNLEMTGQKNPFGPFVSLTQIQLYTKPPRLRLKSTAKQNLLCVFAPCAKRKNFLRGSPRPRLPKF